MSERYAYTATILGTIGVFLAFYWAADRLSAHYHD